MEDHDAASALPQSERRELLEAGRAVLLSLGEGRLAREYSRLAEAASSREELTEALLDCLASRRPRRSRRFSDASRS